MPLRLGFAKIKQSIVQLGTLCMWAPILVWARQDRLIVELAWPEWGCLDDCSGQVGME